MVSKTDADWRPIRNLTLNAGLSLLHTEIDDNTVYAQACSWHGTMVCTVQNPVVFAAGAWNAKINGNPLPNAPAYNLNVSAARYDFPLNNGDRFCSSRPTGSCKARPCWCRTRPSNMRPTAITKAPCASVTKAQQRL